MRSDYESRTLLGVIMRLSACFLVTIIKLKKNLVLFVIKFETVPLITTAPLFLLFFLFTLYFFDLLYPPNVIIT